MTEKPAQAMEEEATEETVQTVDVEDIPKVTVISSEDEHNITVALNDEDHTLGNSLRYMIMKNPNVSYCGYSVPHPSSNKIHIRIQTKEPHPALEALEQGLRDLMDLCGHVLDTFTEELEKEEYLTA
ncbi:uncharacterized protein VTP21DRAFT_8262 [Calcarisporiella thermophila]|uniref:uncharacterized protein n=1 Tax=Calcarisporiella thermophila TaxID=911321 RepID=UPI003743548E